MVKRGTADLDTISDITGIIKKSEIENLFGESDERGYYHVSLDQLKNHRKPNRIFDDPYLDMACLVIAVWGFWFPGLDWLIILALIYNVVGWIHTFYLISKNIHEL